MLLPIDSVKMCLEIEREIERKLNGMPLLKILPRDILIGRATETLRQIVRYDAHDPTGEFDPERFSQVAELMQIQKEVESLGESWSEFYAQIIYEIEIYETERDSSAPDD